ncbi:MAG: SDR family oxidoreductase [Dehalococcoidia bacterium]|jgi:NAD(P)-dependent dehydrogenase (short-subunit alcohol dehydrogenase family)
MLLEGKKALITGSRRGIGAATALRLAAEGADVGINDVERDAEAEKTLAAVARLGRRASWHLADIGDTAARERMFDEFLAEHGRIDILVNNAVASADVPFLEVTEEFWDHLVGHALKGYVFCSQRAAKEMIARGEGGRIVSVSSVHSYRAWSHDTVYGLVKAALNRAAKSMAVDLAGTGITSNCVAPGYIDSRVLTAAEEPGRGGPGYADYAMPWIPNRRGGLPEDIASAVLFLVSPLGDYVNGETITVDGGLLAGGVPAGE